MWPADSGSSAFSGLTKRAAIRMSVLAPKHPSWRVTDVCSSSLVLVWVTVPVAGTELLNLQTSNFHRCTYEMQSCDLKACKQLWPQSLQY